MGLETGSFIGDLVSSNPIGSSDPKSQGDDHIRLLKAVLQGTFPVASRAVYFESAPAAKTGDYTVLITDERALIRMDATGAARTLTLILGSSAFSGFKVTIMKSDTSVNIVTVDGNGAETINGDLTKILRRPFESITVMWTGSAWNIVDRGFDETELIEGANVASAASPNIWEGEGDTHHITGSTGITGFAAAPQAGAVRWLIFDGGPTLTDGANLILPGLQDYNAAAGDIARVYAETTTQFRVTMFPKAGGGMLSLKNISITSVTNLDLTEFSVGTFDHYEVWISNAQPANDVEFLEMETSTNGGSSFDSGASDYSWAGDTIGEGATNNPDAAADDAEIQIKLETAGVGNTANQNMSVKITVYDPQRNEFTPFTWQGLNRGGVGAFSAFSGGGDRQSADDVDALRFHWTTGNWAVGGRIQFIGIRAGF